MFSVGLVMFLMSVVGMIGLSSNPIMLMSLVLMMGGYMAVLLSSFTSTWFGLVVAIVYIGGMLVMFSYFVALSPNQVFSLVPVLGFGAVSYIWLSFMGSGSLVGGGGFQEVKEANLVFDIYLDMIFLLLLVSVLFLVMVLVTKVASRGWGSFRSGVN